MKPENPSHKYDVLLRITLLYSYWHSFCRYFVAQSESNQQRNSEILLKNKKKCICSLKNKENGISLDPNELPLVNKPNIRLKKNINLVTQADSL